MPEYPDITVYLEHLEPLLVGKRVERVRLASPFFLRSVDPPIRDAEGRRVSGLSRLGKRIVLRLDDGSFLVFHLMVAGRLRWRPRGAKLPGKVGLAAFDFESGTLLVTEASSKKRASLHFVRDAAALRAHDPGGLEVLDADLGSFRAALVRESHTLKRALTDPRLFSGIGNAYSDEILHAARLSPVTLARKLSAGEIARLHAAVRDQLALWTGRLRREAGAGFPEKVTAFRPEMAVHGKFGQPCPVCGTAVQRIRYAENEVNYCPRCQTGGRLLADRSLSRLLKSDWPRTIEEAEAER